METPEKIMKEYERLISNEEQAKEELYKFLEENAIEIEDGDIVESLFFRTKHIVLKEFSCEDKFILNDLRENSCGGALVTGKLRRGLVLLEKNGYKNALKITKYGYVADRLRERIMDTSCRCDCYCCKRSN